MRAARSTRGAAAAAAPSSSAISSIAAPTRPTCCASSWTMAARGQALAVLGNHDDKFLRWLKGHDVKLTHGLERTVAQFAGRGRGVRDARRWPSSTGCRATSGSTTGGSPSPTPASSEDMLGRSLARRCAASASTATPPASPTQTACPSASTGRPTIAAAAVVYGHTPVAEPEWLNNTLCIDTGCVFGGKLTALRWPEREIVSVPARQAYAELRRPFGLPPRAARPAQAGALRLRLRFARTHRRSAIRRHL